MARRKKTATTPEPKEPKPEVKAPEPQTDEPTPITIMLNPDEKRIIKTAMKALGMTDASDYVHACLKEASINYARRPFSAPFCKLRKRSILGSDQEG